MTLFGTSNNAVCRLVFCSHEDSLARDTIHVHASTGLEIVEMNEVVFGHEVDNAMLLGDLHGDWEIVGSLRWEVDVNSFLDEWYGRFPLRGAR
jgi:hypothetical protein